MQAPALRLDRFLSFTVLAEPLESAAFAVAETFKQFQLRRPMLRSEEPLSLERLYDVSPPAGGAHPHAVVLYAPKSDARSTVLITNLSDGWSSLSYALAKRLGAKQVQIIATGSEAEYPAVFFHAWVNGAERALMCMRDSHAWVFHAQGTELPFEDSAAYAARRVSKRLTRQMALSYVEALGWKSTDSEFWRAEGNAVYFEQVTLN